MTESTTDQQLVVTATLKKHFRVADSKLELNATQSKLDLVGDYDKQVSQLKTDVRLLSLDKQALVNRIEDLEYPYWPYYPYYPRPIRYRAPSPVRYRR